MLFSAGPHWNCLSAIHSAGGKIIDANVSIPFSRFRRGGISLLALLVCGAGSGHAQSKVLLSEDFQTTPVGSLPSNFVLSGTTPASSASVIEVTDNFHSYVNGTRALRFEDRHAATYPRIKVTTATPATSNLERGWMRLRFVPLQSGSVPTSTYWTPRFYFKLQGLLNQTAVCFQVSGTSLFYHNNGGPAVRLDQTVDLNQENELLVWFDMAGREARAELNRVSAKMADFPNDKLLIPDLPHAIDYLELRAGDTSTYQEGLVVKLVEMGEGDGPEPTHSGTKGIVHVRVGTRAFPFGQPSPDESPASVELDFPSLLRMAGFRDGVKLSSVKVTSAGGTTELPCRWYDRETPKDFPVRAAALNSDPDGNVEPEWGHNFGAVYPAFGQSGIGQLVWMHKQVGGNESEYDIHFQTQPENSPASEPGPLKWVGDGSARFLPPPASPCPTGHVRVACRDWDGDGKADVIYGEQYGLLFFLKNVGTNAAPDFVKQNYVKTDDGNPITLGFSAAPLIVDWNNDNKEDLLIGTQFNRIAYYKNTGSNSNRKFSYQGILRVNGSPLELPKNWNGGGYKSGSSKEYYPILEFADADGDGDKDLLAGGYVTGRIYVFRNVGTSPDNTPLLGFTDDVNHRVKLTGTGTTGVLPDVGGWSAAPTVGDVNGDGHDDLITGVWDRASKGYVLRLFLNNGTNQSPDWKEAPFPKEGSFPPGTMWSPRLVEMTNDQCPDLVVGAGKNIYFFKNVGTPGVPRWKVDVDPIKIPWSSAALSVVQFLPVNGDPQDIYANFKTSLRTTAPNPYAFDPGVAIAPGSQITHPSDEVFFPDLTHHEGGVTLNTQSKLFDMDGDGKLDFIFADWHGQVWFHRNTDTDSVPPFSFESQGTRCVVENDGVTSFIHVNFDGADKMTKTEGGARPVFTVANLDYDAKPDLVLCDVFGNVRFFRGKGMTQGVPHFEPQVFLRGPVVPGVHPITENIRGVDTTDWNQDGRLDVIVGSHKDNSVMVYLKKTTTAGFESGFKPELPTITQPLPIMTDLNGDGGPEDVYIQGTQGSFWVERSFSENMKNHDGNGYAPGTVIEVTQ